MVVRVRRVRENFLGLSRRFRDWQKSPAERTQSGTLSQTIGGYYSLSVHRNNASVPAYRLESDGWTAGLLEGGSVIHLWKPWSSWPEQHSLRALSNSADSRAAGIRHYQRV